MVVGCGVVWWELRGIKLKSLSLTWVPVAVQVPIGVNKSTTTSKASTYQAQRILFEVVQ